MLLSVGLRGEEENWGAYTVDEAASRHGACAEEETTDSRVAYSRFPADRFSRYEEGWLPG